MPLNEGPFKDFLDKLHEIQAAFPIDSSPIRTALVTARAAPGYGLEKACFDYCIDKMIK